MEKITVVMTLEENQVVCGLLEDWLSDKDSHNPHEVRVESAWEKLQSA